MALLAFFLGQYNTRNTPICVTLLKADKVTTAIVIVIVCKCICHKFCLLYGRKIYLSLISLFLNEKMIKALILLSRFLEFVAYTTLN